MTSFNYNGNVLECIVILGTYIIIHPLEGSAKYFTTGTGYLLGRASVGGRAFGGNRKGDLHVFLPLFLTPVTSTSEKGLLLHDTCTFATMVISRSSSFT